MTLALFDFDGTITTKDSFLDFIFFCHGIPKTLLGILCNSPFLILMILKFYPRGKAKEKIWNHFFGGWAEDKFNACATNYVQNRLPQILRPQALKKLAWHKAQGHTIVIVSASFENYLAFWTNKEKVNLLATQGQVIDKRISGRLASKNCHGEEKIRRIKQKYHLKDFNHVAAYGDSRGDLALKTIATEFYYKPFRSKT